MIIYDVATKALDTTNISSAQHRWPDHWLYIYYFVQSGEAFTKEGNKNKHAHKKQLSCILPIPITVTIFNKSYLPTLSNVGRNFISVNLKMLILPLKETGYIFQSAHEKNQVYQDSDNIIFGS